MSTPTLYIWGNADTVVSRVGAEHTGRYVTGPYEFQVLDRASHWIPEEAPVELANLIAEHVRQHALSPPRP